MFTKAALAAFTLSVTLIQPAIPAPLEGLETPKTYVNSCPCPHTAKPLLTNEQKLSCPANPDWNKSDYWGEYDFRGHQQAWCESLHVNMKCNGPVKEAQFKEVGEAGCKECECKEEAPPAEWVKPCLCPTQGEPPSNERQLLQCPYQPNFYDANTDNDPEDFTGNLKGFCESHIVSAKCVGSEKPEFAQSMPDCNQCWCYIKPGTGPQPGTPDEVSGV